MMATEEEDTSVVCANCGKGEESSGDLKACMACKLVKYCNRECQITHRPLHKKACKKRAAELHDEALFKEHTPEECPICFLPLPLDVVQTTFTKSVFNSCCGKIICRGCIHTMDVESFRRGKGRGLCAFCRELPPISDEENTKRIKKLMEADNAYALYTLAVNYESGINGMPQDTTKANKLYLKAGNLGCAEAYHNLGSSYYHGTGVEVNKKKANHLYELAAINGSLDARFNLGVMEKKAGNSHRAYKHFILSAKAGHNKSLDGVKVGFMDGIVTKDEYANTLCAYQSRQDAMKSDGRDKAEEFYQYLANNP